MNAKKTDHEIDKFVYTIQHYRGRKENYLGEIEIGDKNG